MKPLFRERIKSFKHQVKARAKLREHDAFALLMEQGTGKTKPTIEDAAERFLKCNIDVMLVIAPNGVHINWTELELPKHMPKNVEYQAAFWASDMTKKEASAFERVMTPRAYGLRILTINVEALMLDRVREFLRDFIDSAKWGAAVIVDESHKIKNPRIVRTKFVMKLRNRAKVRRILTGTPITNAPFDLWSQFMFLDPDILGVPNYAAFKAEYAHLESEHSGIMRHIAARGVRWTPQIVAKNFDGTPRYKNLERMQALIAPHSYRVLKRDCLDLPEKIYQRVFVTLTKEQRRLYNRLRDELLIEWDGYVSASSKLVSLVRLQQIVCGFFSIEAGVAPTHLFSKGEDNPRIQAMLEVIEESKDQSAIVWARFREDIKTISRALRDAYGEASVVEYHGEVKRKERVEALARMADGTARFFVGQQGSGGTGTTITAASLCVYYSNDFSLENRLQSEDRAHRIGQTKNVTYVDIQARDTIDKKLIATFLAKKNVSDCITGDEAREWLALD
jgi:SNF2 family DNA or RNA helicase